MSRLAKLSLATTVLTFLAVTAGGLVRATGSGLGCPGWPKCYGRWIPPANAHAVIEWNHRFLVQLSAWPPHERPSPRAIPVRERTNSFWTSMEHSIS